MAAHSKRSKWIVEVIAAVTAALVAGGFVIHHLATDPDAHVDWFTKILEPVAVILAGYLCIVLYQIRSTYEELLDKVAGNQDAISTAVEGRMHGILDALIFKPGHGVWPGLKRLLGSINRFLAVSSQHNKVARDIVLHRAARISFLEFLSKSLDEFNSPPGAQLTAQIRVSVYDKVVQTCVERHDRDAWIVRYEPQILDPKLNWSRDFNELIAKIEIPFRFILCVTKNEIKEDLNSSKKSERLVEWFSTVARSNFEVWWVDYDQFSSYFDSAVDKKFHFIVGSGIPAEKFSGSADMCDIVVSLSKSESFGRDPVETYLSTDCQKLCAKIQEAVNSSSSKTGHIMAKKLDSDLLKEIQSEA